MTVTGALGLEQRYGPSKLLRLGRGALFLFLLVLLASWQAEVSLDTLLRDLPKGASELKAFFPPDFSILGELLAPALVTVLLALVPLPIAVALAVPLAFLGAKNLVPRPVRVVARSYITLQRNLPEIVMVLLLVRAFGLGPFHTGDQPSTHIHTQRVYWRIVRLQNRDVSNAFVFDGLRHVPSSLARQSKSHSASQRNRFHAFLYKT